MMSVKELFKSKHLLSDISSFALQNYFCVFFIVWAQIFWHSRISLFPNGQPATKVAWLSSPKAWSQLNSRRKVFYIKKYSLVCILQIFLLRKYTFIHTTKNNTVHIPLFLNSEF